MTCRTVKEAIAEAREYANTSDMSEACFARLDAARTLADEVERLRIALASIRDRGTRGPGAAVCVTVDMLRKIAKQALTAGAKP